MLTLRGVTVRYGTTTVIDDLDWAVGAATAPVSALLGPSGCGKSTLLRAIAGLTSLSAGTVAWDGVDLAPVPVHRRDFGVVFQDGQLFSGRTVAANIAYGLARRRWPRTRISQRVEEMLELVQLPGIGERRVTALSGGQAQRVALARALAPRPRLLLLDEPLAALDARLREDLAFAIGDIVRAAETPTVVVTHDRAEAAMLADSISVMRAGEIVQTAPAQRLWHRPADDWVAGFLGASLIVDASVTGSVLHTPFGQAAAQAVEGLPAQGPCRVALRPESLWAAPAEAGRADGTITHAAVLPGGTRLRVATDAGEVEAMAAEPYAAGEPVRLRLDPRQIAVIGR
ncbi:ABC transporter ATP-binding protein [Gordonia hirsuta]|uniref:ABC transporter ATP-binding protein n=1 Tax=Gordonia hirsuta TaxID=53427 RepID=UPI000462557B|nr:ABC transporter ATP-binding protein [Gordonia hirsuta]